MLVCPITSLTQTTRVCFTAHVWQLILRDVRKHVNVITINAYSWMEAFQETTCHGQQKAVMHRMFSVNIELYPIQSQKSDNLITPYPYQRASGSSQVDFCLTTKTYKINTQHGSNELKQAKHFTAFLQGRRMNFHGRLKRWCLVIFGIHPSQLQRLSLLSGFPTGCRSHDLQITWRDGCWHLKWAKRRKQQLWDAFHCTV